MKLFPWTKLTWTCLTSQLSVAARERLGDNEDLVVSVAMM